MNWFVWRDDILFFFTFLLPQVYDECASYNKNKNNDNDTVDYDSIQCIQKCERRIEQSKSPRAILAKIAHLPKCTLWKRFVRKQFCNPDGSKSCRPAMLRECGKYIHTFMWRFHQKYKSKKTYYDACQLCVHRRLWGPRAPKKEFGCWNEEKNRVCKSPVSGTISHAQMLKAEAMPEMWAHSFSASFLQRAAQRRPAFSVHQRTVGPTVPPTLPLPTLTPTRSPTPPPTESPVPVPTPPPARKRAASLPVWLVNKARLSANDAEKVKSACELEKISTVKQLQEACCGKMKEDDDPSDNKMSLPVPALRESCELVEEAFESC
jgi:hypothetical protein